MIHLLNTVAFFWLCGWVLLSIRSIYRGRRDSVAFVTIAHFVLTGVPLILDVLIGRPDYRKFPGFSLASGDELTTIIYVFYVGFVPLVLWKYGRAKKRQAIIVSEVTRYRKYAWVYWIAIVSPIVAVMFSPARETYLLWAERVQAMLDNVDGRNGNHAIIAGLSTVSALGVAGLVLSMKRVSAITVLPLVPFLIIDAWLNGKRAIVLVIMVTLGYALWERGYLRRKRLVAAGAAAVVAFAAYSMAYQKAFRAIGVDRGGTAFYQNVRIDYGRDAVIKLAIFSELNPQRIRILEYRGQSLLFDATAFIPRRLWPDKPLPYAQYVTSAIFMQKPRMWGWGMTTSWLGEAIANFSWIGLVMGPLVIALVCRIGDNNRMGVVGTLTIIVASLLLAVEITAFAPLALLWAAAVVSARRRIRRARRRRIMQNLGLARTIVTPQPGFR